MFIPWRYISTWKCIRCAKCCKSYSVVLNFNEWLHIIKNYGVENTVSGLNKLFVNRRADGSCFFLHQFPRMFLCGLQHMKPKACKLWPFKITNRPKFGYANQALYPYFTQKLFIYADSECNGLVYGEPTVEFATFTLRELIEILLGLRYTQFKTTGGLPALY